MGPIYIIWTFCTWTCQLWIYLCILDLAFDSLYEGIILWLFEFILWYFWFVTIIWFEICFWYLYDIFVFNYFYLIISKYYKLRIFSMGRIYISILIQIIYIYFIFSFLIGRHFGLVGIETFVKNLGLPLTWSMPVLDVLLLLFSVFFCKSNLH